MLLVLPLLPIVAGLALWPFGRGVSRTTLGAAALLALLATAASGAWAVAARPQAQVAWGGPLRLQLAVTDAVAVMIVLVIAITAAVITYAAWHEDRPGLERLLGLLIVFAGGMLLLVLAADLLTLLIGFELTAATSWALIAHEWRDGHKAAAAAHAFNVTRFGSLGLLLAAGAAIAGVEDLSFGALEGLSGWPLHAFAAGLLLAAATKSALVPFSPWLFSAMAGPTSVSALLHSATMVAAGAWALIRLHEPLTAAPWFGPVAIALGLVTAVTGGVVAIAQPRAKELLAASTSAHYGLMVAAVGAGAAGAGLAHLVTHAVAKALLFLTAGVALSVTGSHLLADHRLARLRHVAATAWIGALALAAVPPLGAAWSKEKVVAGLGHVHPAVAVVGIVAGGLSAFYALRFAMLAFGPTRGDDHRDLESIHPPIIVATTSLAVASVLLGVLWVTPAHIVESFTGLPLLDGEVWEVGLSLTIVAAAAYAARSLLRRDELATLAPVPASRLRTADWLGLPTLSRRVVVDRTLRWSCAAARFDDRVVDAGVEAAARVGAALGRLWDRVLEVPADNLVEKLATVTIRAAGRSAEADECGVDRAVDGIAFVVGDAGRDVRRTQTGLAHHYYVIVTGGLAAVVTILLLSR